jgi:hypothetical protein
MAKESGIGMTVTVDNSSAAGKNISNDLTSVTFDTPRGTQDITGLDVASIERLALLADGTVTLNGVFNDTADMSHAVLKDIATSIVLRTVAIAISGQTLTLEVLFTSYALNRAADGSLTFSASGQLAATTAFGWS